MPQNVASTTGADTIIGSVPLPNLEGDDSILGHAELDALFFQRQNSLASPAMPETRLRRQQQGQRRHRRECRSRPGIRRRGRRHHVSAEFHRDDDTLYILLVADVARRMRTSSSAASATIFYSGRRATRRCSATKSSTWSMPAAAPTRCSAARATNSVNGDADDDLLIGGEGDDAIHGGRRHRPFSLGRDRDESVRRWPRRRHRDARRGLRHILQRRGATGG